MEKSGVVAVRDMTWYRQWRHTCFANIGQCFQWGATKVILAGIKGELRNKFTMEEFPSLVQDLQDGFGQRTPPLHKGEYNAVQERRISIEDIESLFLEAREDVFVILASVPNQYFEVVQLAAGTNRNVIVSYGEAADCASGMPRDAPKAPKAPSTGGSPSFQSTSNDFAIVVVSAGYAHGNSASFFIGNQRVTQATNGRGLNCVSFDPTSPISFDCALFDTHAGYSGIGSAAVSKAFQDWVNAVPDGNLVLIAVKDEASSGADAGMYSALEKLGAKLKFKWRGPYALIAVKGRRCIEEVAGDDKPDRGMVAAFSRLSEFREAIAST